MLWMSEGREFLCTSRECWPEVFNMGDVCRRKKLPGRALHMEIQTGKRFKRTRCEC